MERLASGCSAIQGTACNKRVRFLVPSSLFVSLHLASSPLSLSFSHSFSLFPSPISHSFSFSFFFFFFCSLSFSLSEIHRRRDHRVILVYLAHVGRAHNTALPLGCTHSQAVYTHAHTHTHTNATRSTVKRRRDEKSVATGFHEAANRPQNLAEAQKNRLLLLFVSLSLFLFWSVAIVRRGPRSVLSLRSLRPRRGSSFDANTFPAFFLLSLALSSSFLLLLSRFLLRPILPRPQTPDSTFAFRVAELPLKAAPLHAGEISRGGEGRGERGGGEGKDVAGDDRCSLDAEEDRLDLKSTKS